MGGDYGDIELRTALPGDAEKVAHLWIEAFSEKFDRMLGDKTRPFLKDWFERDVSIYDGTTLAIADGKVAGYIQLSGPKRSELKQAMILCPLLIRYFGIFGGLLRLFKLWITEWGHDFGKNDLYIFMVGVDSAFRRRGIAWRLLEYARNEAIRRGKERVVLGVVDYNEKAIALYLKFGFSQSELITFPLLYWASGVKGYYDMIYTMP